MKHLTTFFTIYLIFGLTVLRAQSVTGETAAISIDFSKSSTPDPSIKFFKPEALVSSRGFKEIKKVNKAIIEIEGVVKSKDGVGIFEVNNVPITVQENGFFTVDLNLNIGINELVFQIIDEKNAIHKKVYSIERELGNSTIDDRIVEYLGEKKYYALLIGVNEYDDKTIDQLDQPISDALKFKEVLQNNYTFDEENIKVLENPSRTDIIESFDQLSTVINEQDNLLIFYAGHGIWDEGLQQGYWLPRDSKKTSKAAWLSNGTIRDYIGGIKSKNTLLIADACFSGGIFKSRSVTSKYQGILELYKLPSRKAMTSGNMKTVPDVSVFMKYLMKRLNENTNKYIHSSKLFESFKEAVINNGGINPNVPQYGTVQDAGDEGGDFIFILRE